MIHIAIGFLVVSVTFVALVFASLVVPGAPAVDSQYVTATCFAMVMSSVLLSYVRRHRL